MKNQIQALVRVIKVARAYREDNVPSQIEEVSIHFQLFQFSIFSQNHQKNQTFHLGSVSWIRCSSKQQERFEILQRYSHLNRS